MSPAASTRSATGVGRRPSRGRRYTDHAVGSTEIGNFDINQHAIATTTANGSNRGSSRSSPSTVRQARTPSTGKK